MSRFDAVLRHAVLALVVLALALRPPATVYGEGTLRLTATAAFDGNYTPGTWLPVAVSLGNDGPAREVLVAAETPGATFRNVQTVDLPTGAEKQITLYVAIEQETRQLRLSVEQQGAVLAAQELELRPRSGERMLGLLAAQDPRLRLPRRQDLTALPFNTFALAVESFPLRAAGLSSLSLLLLSDVPGEGLRAEQRDALLGWVHAGGHLVLGGGPSAGRTAAGLPPALLPATPGEARAIDDEPLAALAGAPGPGRLDGVLLLAVPGARAAGAEEAPAWVSHQVGRGMVTQLAFDPGQPAMADWPSAPGFWDQLLRPALFASSPAGRQASVDPIQEQIITGSLTNLPAIQLPATDQIFLVLAIYAVLVGPGVALLLRRLDRQTWAWLVVPACALAVGALVLGMAVAMRPDQRLVSRASLIELLEPGQARVREYVGVLVPQDQTLPLSMSDDALTRPLRQTGGLYSGVEGVGGDLAQLSATASIDLAAWSLQGLLADQQLALSEFSASISVANETLQVELINDSDQYLRDAVAVYGEQVLALGTLAPGERRAALWPAEAADAERRDLPISYLVLGAALEAGRGPGQSPARELLVREALINAAVVQSDTLTDEGPLVLAWPERSPLDLRVEGPAALQETALLVLRPAISGSGPLALPDGWLAPDWASLAQPRCSGSQGPGIPASPAPTSFALRLPAGLATMRAEEVTLRIESEQRWPSAGVTTEIYSWGQGRWVELTFDGPGALRIAPAEDYLRNGQLQLRFDGQITATRCLYVSGELRGVMP